MSQAACISPMSQDSSAPSADIPRLQPEQLYPSYCYDAFASWAGIPSCLPHRHLRHQVRYMCLLPCSASALVRNTSLPTQVAHSVLHKPYMSTTPPRLFHECRWRQNIPLGSCCRSRPAPTTFSLASSVAAILIAIMPPID